jgi:SAM-dependent methyltransferase
MLCLLCNSDRTARIGHCSSAYTAFSYFLYSCGDCGSRFFDHEEHPVSLKEKYDQHAQSNAIRYRGEFKFSPYWANEVSRLRSLHAGPVKSVLDIGCRTGDFLMHWPAQVARSGIELSAYSAGVARDRGLHVMEGFLEELSITSRYDVVTLYAILEHLREPREFMRCLPDLVAEDGVIAILIPSFQCIKEKMLSLIRKQWHMYSPPEHLNFMSREYLDATMSRMGFDLVSRHFTSGGMFNPFGKIPLLSKSFHKVWSLAEYRTPLNRIPLFDHMYSYYSRRDRPGRNR